MGLLIQTWGLIVAFSVAMKGLRRIGIDVGWLNPFTFLHRCAWRNKVQTPAIYTLRHPVDVAGVMALATVQATGEVSAQQKAGVIALLQRHLGMDEKTADDLWLSSSYLLRTHGLKPQEVSAVLQRSADQFSAYHIETLKTLMRDAAALEPTATEAQQALLAAVEDFFSKRAAVQQNWKW